MRLANPKFGEVATASSARASVIHGSYDTIKPWLDLVLALVLLPISAPIIAVAILLVRLSSRGPVIYTQKRLGLGGKVFTIYKIRTMYLDSERHCGPSWSVPGDPRITPVGRILRWSHVDELPQLMNILMGEMSLVGPRPERPEFLEALERDLPGYRRRLAVRPGLTGLAQVQQPPDVDLFSVRRKLIYDLYYVDHFNPWLDFRVILGTVLKCLGVPFAWIGRLLQLPNPTGRGGRGPLLPEAELSVSSLAPDSYVG
jgi:lipopolysaccharide/colanic/teichoic acid biosynthesis glycosyltransferase